MEYSRFLSVQVNQISSVIPCHPWGPWGVSTTACASQIICLASASSTAIVSPGISSLRILRSPNWFSHFWAMDGYGNHMQLILTYVYTVYIYVHINYEIVTSIPFGHVPSTSSFGCNFLLLTQPLRFPNHFLSSKKDSRAKGQECRPGECHWYLQIWVADKINCSPKFPKVRLGRPLSVVKLFVFFKTSSRQKK